MTVQNTMKGLAVAADPDDLPDTPRRMPSPLSVLHVLWLRKWPLIVTWLILAVPTGVVLSIFDLPQSYNASTVLRFPNVVGAQTNVMRDIAITQRESILGIFNSFQVLDGTVRKLALRMRIATPDVFHRNTFRALRYSDNLGAGRYTLEIGAGQRQAKVRYLPQGAREELTMFEGRVGADGRLSLEGLEMELQPALLKSGAGLSVAMEFSSLEQTVQDLKKAMGARSLGTSNFQITMKDRDPYLVSDILNTLRDEFLQVYYGTTEVQDVGILVQMEKDLEVAKQKLDKSQDDLSKHYAAHPELMQRQATADPGDNLAYLEARQDQDRVARSKTRMESVMAARPQDGGAEARQFWAGEVLQAMSEAGEPKANIMRASLADLGTRQTQARATLGPEHPRILEIESQKDALYLQIEEGAAALARRLDKDLSDLRVKVASSTPVRAGQVPMRVQLELERLNVTNQNNQQIYDRLQENYNRAKLVTGSEFFKVTVVDPARPAIYVPPSLKSRLLFAIAAVAALFVALPSFYMAWGLVFLKVWTRDDVQRLLRMKPLGVVGQSPAGIRPVPGKNGEPGGARTEADPGDGTTVRPPDPLLLFFGSGYRIEDLEAYRIIREETENFFRGASDGKYCLMVTSTQPNEGKTLITSNLAMTFARKGKRTLLVDADFRLGRVDKVFNMPGGIGLDELLAQAEMSDEQFMGMASMCYRPTMQRNLVVAPRMRFNPNAGELVSSDRFKAFIRMARTQFDVVLIDTPPVMITPEPLSLAEVTDGVIFVCRSGITSVSEAQEGVKVLLERGVRVAAVLNGVRQSPFEQNRYKKYSYYYQAQPKPGEPGDQG